MPSIRCDYYVSSLLIFFFFFISTGINNGRWKDITFAEPPPRRRIWLIYLSRIQLCRRRTGDFWFPDRYKYSQRAVRHFRLGTIMSYDRFVQSEIHRTRSTLSLLITTTPRRSVWEYYDRSTNNTLKHLTSLKPGVVKYSSTCIKKLLQI